MFLVKEMQANDVLPQEFIDTLPKVCPKCGEPTQITETLTALSCTNPMCEAKLSRRMVSMLVDMGVKGLGEAKCSDFIETYHLKSPYALIQFAAEFSKARKPFSPKVTVDFTESIVKSINLKREMMLWEYVKIGNFSGIRDSARALFDGYANIEAFYEDFDKGGVKFITERLGIKADGAVSVKATEICSVLSKYRNELKFYQKFFKIQQITKSINICISRAVGSPFESKQDFVSTINKKYGNYTHINNLSSLSKACTCLIWSKQGAPTSKVEKAKKLGVPIVTGNGFDVLLKIGSEVASLDVVQLLPIIEELEKENMTITVADVYKKLQSLQG